MTASEASSLRTSLRADLAGDHDRVDALFSSLDLASRGGFTHFARAHLWSLACLMPGTDTQPSEVATMVGTLADLCMRLESDLDALGQSPISDTQHSPRRYHPIAIEYIVLGSRLGAQQLRVRWSATSDPAVRRAAAYFAAPPLSEEWRDLCVRLAATPAAGGEADIVVRHARDIFGIFARGFHLAGKATADLEMA